MERAYTVTELDALRRAVENKWVWGRYSGPVMMRSPDGHCQSSSSPSYRGEEKTVAVEAMVRTHMLAGHTAEDLYAAEPGREPIDVPA